MVSTRPSPKPAQGRIRYPGAQHYTPGDVGHLPSYASPGEASTSAAALASASAPAAPAAPGPHKLAKSRSADSDGGRRKWWKFWEGSDREDGGGGGSASGANFKQPLSLGRKRAMTVPNRDARDCKVFGTPLEMSIGIASTKISTGDANGQLYVYGSIPVVVAKTGLRLKEIALDKEGIFRIPGNAKRVAALQAVFEQSPAFGQDVDWSADDFRQFSAHDVATVFRRYLLALPAPLVPANLRRAFLSVIPVDKRDDQSRPADVCCAEFRALIEAMPEANRHTLHYVLDLLSTFAERHEQTKMTEHNLAVMFQPSIFGVGSNEELANLSSPERMKSTVALAFMIENQARILAGTKIRKTGSSSRRTGPTHAARATAEAENDAGAEADAEPEAAETPLSSPPSTPALASSQPSLQALSPVSPVTSAVPPAIDTVTEVQKPTVEGVVIEADAIAQSDSDDDAPAGGYMLIESKKPAPRTATAEPSPAAAPPANAAKKPETSVTRTPSLPRAGKTSKLSLNPFAAPPSRRRSKTGKTASASKQTGAARPAQPAADAGFDPSDSDDEPPVSGYATVENPRFAGPAAGGRALLGRSRTLNRPDGRGAPRPSARGHASPALSGAGVVPQREAHAQTQPRDGAGLQRRSTLPPRLGGHFARFRRVQEA